MSVYYLDAADIAMMRQLFETYDAEARRLITARLPVPAHYYVLKCSHAFNVLDARGAIGTTERARRLARGVDQTAVKEELFEGPAESRAMARRRHAWQ